MDQPTPEIEPEQNASETKDLNLVQRLSGVFFSPGKTFEHLERKPDWLIPFVLITVVSFVFVLLIMPVSIPEQMALQREKMEERGASNEQIEQMQAISEKWGRMIGSFMGFVGPGLGLIVVTLFYWFIGNVILGGQTSFLKLFSVCTYISMISILDMAIKLPLILTKKTVDIGLNLSVLLPEGLTDTLLADILQVMDIFAVWRFIVMAIGLSAVYKFSLTKSGWTMGILFLIRSIVAVLFLQLRALGS